MTLIKEAEPEKVSASSLTAIRSLSSQYSVLLTSVCFTTRNLQVIKQVTFLNSICKAVSYHSEEKKVPGKIKCLCWHTQALLTLTEQQMVPYSMGKGE